MNPTFNYIVLYRKPNNLPETKSFYEREEALKCLMEMPNESRAALFISIPYILNTIDVNATTTKLCSIQRSITAKECLSDPNILSTKEQEILEELEKLDENFERIN